MVFQGERGEERKGDHEGGGGKGDGSLEMRDERRKTREAGCGVWVCLMGVAGWRYAKVGNFRPIFVKSPDTELCFKNSCQRSVLRHILAVLTLPW